MRALTRTGPIMPVSLPFIPTLCPLLETTDYAGNYARIIAASLITNSAVEYTFPSPDGDDNSLSALIRARHKSREEEMDGFFDSLEEKYAKKSTKTKGKTKSQGKKTSAKKGKK